MTKLEQPSGIVVVCHPVHWPISPQDVVDALPPALLALPRESLTIDAVKFGLDQGIQVDWEQAGQATLDQMRALRSLLDRHPHYVVTYFGGAPVPLALLAGFHVGTWAAVRVFQQRHRGKSWRWAEGEHPVQVLPPTGLPTATIRARGDAVVCVQTSYAMDLGDVRAVVPHAIAEVVVSTAPIDLDVLQTEADVEEVARVFTEVLDRLGATCPNLDNIHLFIAAPVGMVFRLGTCISVTAHPRIKIYFYSRHAEPKYRCAFAVQDLAAPPAGTTPDRARGTSTSPPLAGPTRRRRPSPGMGYDVFIVHAAPDKRVARSLADALDQAGAVAFLDERDQEAGAPWDEAIERELRNSLLQVVLLGTSDRWYQHEEIDLAIKNMRSIGATDRVIPVLLTPRERLPYGINRVQALDWAGAEQVAARLKDKVQECRGAGPGSVGRGTQHRISVAVVGVRDELRATLDKLAVRLGQRSDILDGAVRIVDAADASLPPVDLTVVVLRARHKGRLDALPTLTALVERSRRESPNVIAGALTVNDDEIEEAHADEAPAVARLKRGLTIKDAYESVLLGKLDESVAAWYSARHANQPGRSAVREPWEARYLDHKAKIWRAGSGSARDRDGGRSIERAQWFIHLQAQTPWVTVAGEIRHTVRVRLGEPQSPASNAPHRSHEHLGRREEPHGKVPVRAYLTSTEREVLHPTLWWAGEIDPEREVPDDSAAFRQWQQPAEAAWLDQVLSHPLVPRCLVVGLAGAGKTVLLEHLATVLASDEPPGDPAEPRHRVDRAAIRGGSPIAPIPVLHRATTVVAHLRGAGGDACAMPIALEELLVSKDTFGGAADRDAVRAGIEAGRYVFLIDGLDEVPTTADRHALVDALGSLQGAHPRVILTTRPGVYTDVDVPRGFAVVEVAPLDDEAATRLATAWARTHMPEDDLTKVLLAVASVRGRFPRRGDEPSPVESPLLLDSLLWVYKALHRLPGDVATLYREMVRNLCRRRIQAASDLDGDTAAERYGEALRHLFLAAQEGGGAGLPVAEAREVVSAHGYASRDTARAWLERLANHTALIRFEGSGEDAFVRPWHRSYQEYLAAEAVVFRYINRAADGVAWLRAPRGNEPSRLTDPVWRHSLRFLIGAAQQERSWGAKLVEALFTAAKEGGADQGHLYRLLAEGLDEYRADFPPRVVESFADQLVRDFEARGERWPLVERLDALEALGRLGDPRLAREKMWEPIEAGPAWVDERDEERPHHVAAFEIMWRPVTVADYQPFVADPSYPTWFGSDAPREVIEFGCPGGWQEQLEHRNRPVVEVSWYEAQAYARWLDAQVGGGVTLPTELQWCRAARGPDALEYPWSRAGEDDDPGRGDAARANYDWGEGSLKHPSPVGAFPRGNRGKLVDLAGNVLQWCLDERSAGSSRVMRGGSWYDGAWLVRAAVRFGVDPGDRFSIVGFRLARGHQAK